MQQQNKQKQMKISQAKINNKIHLYTLTAKLKMETTTKKEFK